MNETDVREVIVRPLLHRLGYQHGTPANIRTEVPLRYDRAFLGRKKPDKDPPLRGRADYICEAVSYGRWAVEVKAPSEELTQDDVEQAHTYCAHPEISAAYFLLTNGREFRLYATGRLDRPQLSWSFESAEENMLALFNTVGYEAIKRLHKTLAVDPNKPLGPGLGSQLRIVGGEVTYGEHRSDFPVGNSSPIEGLRGAVTGGTVKRDEDGRIHAVVSYLSPLQQFEELNRIAGIGDLEFFSAEEYVSDQVGRPTIFQNVMLGQIPPDTPAVLAFGQPKVPLPFGFDFKVYTQAVGYVRDNTFEKTLLFDYQYRLIRSQRPANPQLALIAAALPPTMRIEGEATFRIVTQRDHR